ncbi:hypothetical protein [uncultured Mobiluncus sp.]|uniref:hypothetical protein n=1 Tax=uncultured Mobiluncus sp. TaxID=293425 RepID=UPI00262D58F4|nr:hypothetical protein [uncultured Mobiluncus sp.]
MAEHGKPGLKEQFKYHFDNLMSKGMLGKIFLLGLLSIAFLFIVFVLTRIFVRTPMDPGEQLWVTLMRTFDPGNLNGDEEIYSRVFVFFMLLATLYGIFFLATFIGIINNGLENYMDALNQGKSHVLESNHTVLLGFNEIAFNILEQLFQANLSESKKTVVILSSDHDPQELDRAIRNRFRSGLEDGTSQRKYQKHTRVICRKGEIYAENDLAMCSLEHCHSVIINANNDFYTIKAIMACRKYLENVAAGSEQNQPQHPEPHITAVIHQKKNINAAYIAGGDFLEVICYEEFMSRIMANSARQPGLSYVFSMLFNYQDSEIYSVDTANLRLNGTPLPLENVSLYEINQYFKNALAIGGFTEQNAPRLSVDDKLNRRQFPHSLLFPSIVNEANPGTLRGFKKLYLIEEDNGVEELTEKVCDWSNDPKPWTVPDKPQGNIVIIGANHLLHSVLEGFSGFLCDNASILVLDDASKIAQANNFCPKGLDVRYAACNIDSYEELAKWLPTPDPASPGCGPSWDCTRSILILSDFRWEPDDDSHPDPQDLYNRMSLADEKTLSRLLYVRQLCAQAPEPYSITCEMNLEQNRKLAEYTGNEDYVVGTSVTALIIAQVSESRDLHLVFRELLSPDGSELYMRKAGSYLGFTDSPKSFNFFEMLALTAQKNEVLIGFRRRGANGQYETPVILPPRYDAKGALIQYLLEPDDLLITIAEQ